MRISDWSSDVCSSDLRIIRERRVQRFAEGHRLGRDHMFQRTTLDAGEDRRIELLGQHLVIGEDQAAARTAQRLVRGRRHAMGIFERRSEERRVGTVCFSTLSSGWSLDNYKNK